MKKKIFSILLIAVMVLSSFSAVFADDDTTTITVKGGLNGHTYTAYQIFTGSTSATDNELTGIQWGADAPQTLKDQYDTAAAAADAIKNMTPNQIREWAKDLALSGEGTQQKTVGTDGNVVFTGLEKGYYVVLDSGWAGTGTAPDNDFDSAVIVQVVGPAEVNIKGDKPSSEKKVANNNDSVRLQPDLSELQNTDWEDAADYDIGDAVPFKLTATTAGNVSSYEKYHITFVDKQATGLEAPTQWTVSVLGKEFTVTSSADPDAQTTDAGTKITVKKDAAGDGNTFAIKVEFEPTGDDAKYLAEECNKAVIEVKYTSVLTGDGVSFGKDGYPNEMFIKYSNNPDGDDEGTTPKDTVIVFTYRTVVDKVDETGAPLKGAEFTLYKEVKEGATGAVKGSEITFDEGVLHDDIKADKYYKAIKLVAIDGSNETSFKFDGIDDGSYVLVETKVPTGYNAIKSQAFTITSTLVQGQEPALDTLVATAPFTASADGTAKVTKTDKTEHAVAKGEAYAEIINTSGAVLPETGGMGTTIIYILGAALVIGAGVVLVSRKRSNDR